METIKKRILLEDSVDRNYDSKTWGSITASTFYLNIQLNQTIDDMGLFTDLTFIEQKDGATVNYDILIDKLQSEGYSFPFMNNVRPIDFSQMLSPLDRVVLRLPKKTLSQYYFYGNNVLSGFTDSKINDVRSYKKTEPYIPNFNINTEDYNNYLGVLIEGVNRVVTVGEPVIIPE